MIFQRAQISKDHSERNKLFSPSRWKGFIIGETVHWRAPLWIVGQSCTRDSQNIQIITIISVTFNGWRKIPLGKDSWTSETAQTPTTELNWPEWPSPGTSYYGTTRHHASFQRGQSRVLSSYDDYETHQWTMPQGKPKETVVANMTWRLTTDSIWMKPCLFSWLRKKKKNLSNPSMIVRLWQSGKQL